jgi:hypothetical protein
MRPGTKVEIEIAILVLASLTTPSFVFAQRAGRGPSLRHTACGQVPVNFIELSGRGLKHTSLPVTKLKSMETSETDLADRDGSRKTFHGVSLADVLKMAGLDRARLTKTPEEQLVVKVIGQDCSYAVFSLREVLHSTRILLAESAADGLADTQHNLLPTLIADWNGARTVKAVSFIEVRRTR